MRPGDNGARGVPGINVGFVGKGKKYTARQPRGVALDAQDKAEAVPHRRRSAGLKAGRFKDM